MSMRPEIFLVHTCFLLSSLSFYFILFACSNPCLSFSFFQEKYQALPYLVSMENLAGP